MKRAHNVIAAAAMFLIIIAVLITSFQAAVYGDSTYQFYEEEYEKYHVTRDLNMTMENVMEVTGYMMDYLIGEEDELSIVTDVDGKEQDFFNEQDRLHMLDVRNLFLGGLRFRTYLIIAAILLYLVLISTKADLKYLVPRSYTWAKIVFLAVVAFLGCAFAIDFTACFTIFHELFFTNDLWLFDPATDYMIRMLPEGFFSDMVLRIGMTFLLMLVGIQILMQVWKKMVRKQE